MSVYTCTWAWHRTHVHVSSVFSRFFTPHSMPLGSGHLLAGRPHPSHMLPLSAALALSLLVHHLEFSSQLVPLHRSGPGEDRGQEARE